MKKLTVTLLIMFICVSAAYSAEDKKAGEWGENSSVFNKGFENQEPVTQTKLKKTIDMLKERSLSKKQKKLRDSVKPLSPAADNEYLKEFARSQSPDDDLSQTHTVMIPVTAYNEFGQTIPPGYYKLSCRKIAKDTYVLDLSQGTKTIMSVNANHTEQDLGQDTISFCNAEIIKDGTLRLIYGSIDLNLAGYLYFK